MNKDFNQSKLPYDENAELSVIGSLLIDGQCISDVLNICDSTHFFTDRNRLIFESCEKLYSRGEAIDQITVARQLSAENKLAEVGGASYLALTVAEVPTSANVEYYARIVKNTAILRECISYASLVQRKATETADPKDLIQFMEQSFLNIQAELAIPHLMTPQQVTELGLNRYASLMNGQSQAVKTGIPDLDKLTGGMHPKEYWILGARPSMGKTTLAMQIAKNITKQNNSNVLMVSLEQGWDEILDRRVASLIEKPIRIVRAGKYEPPELYDRILASVGQLSSENIFFYDSGEDSQHEEATIQSIYSIANHMKLSYGLSAMFIDYIGLIEDDYGKSSYERISYISRKIKRLCRVLNIPIMVICQLSRMLEQHVDRRPKLSDLRDSGNLEQDADVVLFLYRDDYYQDIKEAKLNDNIDVTGQAQIIMAKQRQGGSTSEIEIKLRWDRQKQEYQNLVKEYASPEAFR